MESPVWEYRWRYVDIHDDAKVKESPYWFTDEEARRTMRLSNGWAEKMKETRRMRVGEPEWKRDLCPPLIVTKGREWPDYNVPTDDELRALWRRYSDPDVRRTILELVRIRRDLPMLTDLCETVRDAWSKEVGGHLVAIHALRIGLKDARRRAGEI